MVKIFFCLVVVGLFISCSGDLKMGPVDDKEGQGFDPIQPSGRITEGFQKHANHLYGFDSYDDEVHISLPTDAIGYIKVFTDKVQAEDFDYFYCDLNGNPLNDLEYIPAGEKQEHTLKIESNFSRKEIALCREKIDGTLFKVIQRLYIHRYPWKRYDFHVYTFENKNDRKNRFLEDNSFWDEFDHVYRQAIVESGNVSKNLDGYIQRSYVLSRARGDYNYIAYDNIKCVEGDIGKVINEMDEKTLPKKNATIQIDYPTKRFWPLKKADHYLEKIEICGKSDFQEDPTTMRNITFTLELLPNAPPYLGCSDRIINGITVRWYAQENAWYLVYNNGDVELATVDNAHPGCAVLVEKNIYALGRQYVGEIPKDADAAMIREPNKKVSIVVLPWLGDLATTKRAAFHELGHTMGLDDVREKNLMYKKSGETSTLLQKRSVTSNSNGKQENQWECLQGIDVNKNCADPNSIYRGQ